MALVVKKAAKEIASKKEIRFPDAAVEALDHKVEEMILTAVKRAEGNGRKTIKPVDF